MINTDLDTLVILLSNAIVHAFAYPKEIYGDIPRESTVFALARQCACECNGVCEDCATDHGSYMQRDGTGRWGDAWSAIEVLPCGLRRLKAGAR